jgi:hypothetical protein
MPTMKNAWECHLFEVEQPITETVFKIGGFPVLLEDIEWPTCKACGKDMDFIAQIPLTAEMGMAGEYDMLYLFMCEGSLNERRHAICRRWDGTSGASLGLMQKGQEPRVVQPKGNIYPEYGARFVLYSEPDINTDWQDKPPEHCDLVRECTKIGGVPQWLMGDFSTACPLCGGKMRFAAQIGYEIEDYEKRKAFRDAAQDGLRRISAHYMGPNRHQDLVISLPDEPERHHLPFEDGLAYVFICEKQCSPTSVVFFFQAT